jgi:hypothetical protein
MSLTPERVSSTMAEQFFRISARQREAIRGCLVQLDQARIDLEAQDQRDGKADRIIVQLENCHNSIHGVLNALTAAT